jgi:hypothetical protein
MDSNIGWKRVQVRFIFELTEQHLQDSAIAASLRSPIPSELKSIISVTEGLPTKLFLYRFFGSVTSKFIVY